MDRNRASATAEAVEAILANATSILCTTSYSVIKLEWAISALASIARGPALFRSVGNGRTDRFFTRLKLTRVKRGDYRFSLRTLMADTPGNSPISPFDLEEWRRLIALFDLRSVFGFPERLSIIMELTTRLVESPALMAMGSYSDSMTFPLLLEKGDCAMRL